MSVESLRELPRPLAFVLPGGGALGAYQVGVLRALAEHESRRPARRCLRRPLNAAYVAWSPGLDGLVALERVWRSVRRRDLLRVHPGRSGIGLHRPAGVVPRQPLRRGWIRRTLGERQIEDAPTRLAVVATDVTTGRAVALTHGDVVSAVLGSAGVPRRVPAGLARRSVADRRRRGRRRPPRPHRRPGRRQRCGAVRAGTRRRPAEDCARSTCCSGPRRSASRPTAARCSPVHRRD